MNLYVDISSLKGIRPGDQMTAASPVFGPSVVIAGEAIQSNGYPTM